MKKKYILILINLFVFNLMFSQMTEQELKNKLDELSKTQKGLNELIQTNVSQISLYDFITSISVEHELNVSVEASLDQKIINNFHNILVKDVFIFLVRKYNLEIDFLNNIILFKKPKIIEPIAKKYVPKKIDLSYNKANDFLSVKLNKDTLLYVAKAIIDKSGKNIILSPDVKNIKVTSYILNRPFDQVIDMMAKSNKLKINKDDNGFYFVEADHTKPIENNTNSGKRNSSRKPRNKNISDLKVDGIAGTKNLKIVADNVSVMDIIYEASAKSEEQFFLYTPIDENLTSTFFIDNISFEELLDHLLKGSKYTFKKEKDFFLIGEKDTEGLRTTELIQLENRRIETVIEAIPKRMTGELELKEFVELNGFVASGHYSAIEELKDFVHQIDVNVPLIQIEVLIVQYDKSYDIQTGLQAGVGDAPAQSSLGSLFPTSDVTLNSSQVNDLIGAFNGLGIFNIGKVTNNFFLSLKALENNSIIKLESTPKISTLNGHEASFSIGATDYYFEQTNRLISQGVNDNILQSGQWRPTEANLSLRIKPFVSKDEDVTLEISVEKSAFTGRSGEGAPPGKTTQRFESLVRVKNSEMILLGGLDEMEKENSGTGTPFLSRIPVIKWLFSGRKKKKSKSKLHIFIKPTVYYQ